MNGLILNKIPLKGATKGLIKDSEALLVYKWLNVHVPIIMLYWTTHDINDLVQDCGNSSALALELLQSCTKPSIYTTTVPKFWTDKYVILI